jgi:hypothetical protein
MAGIVVKGFQGVQKGMERGDATIAAYIEESFEKKKAGGSSFRFFWEAAPPAETETQDTTAIIFVAKR